MCLWRLRRRLRDWCLITGFKRFSLVREFLRSIWCLSGLWLMLMIITWLSSWRREDFHLLLVRGRGQSSHPTSISILRRSLTQSTWKSFSTKSISTQGSQFLKKKCCSQDLKIKAISKHTQKMTKTSLSSKFRRSIKTWSFRSFKRSMLSLKTLLRSCIISFLARISRVYRNWDI